MHLRNIKKNLCKIVEWVAYLSLELINYVFCIIVYVTSSKESNRLFECQSIHTNALQNDTISRYGGVVEHGCNQSHTETFFVYSCYIL